MKTILCYGDSNTHGYPAENADVIGRYPRDIRWTGRLQGELGGEYLVLEEGLNGRTTVWDDPIEEHKNGKRYLYGCLETHKPLDLVSIMLGTNDLKSRFAVTAYDIGRSIETLVGIVQRSRSGVDFGVPEILVVAPAPIIEGQEDMFNQMFKGGIEKGRELAKYYKITADTMGVHFLDAAKAEVSPADGIHLTKKGHEYLAGIMAAKVREILG